MSQPDRIYLDNAATSWPKPPEVYAAVNRYLRENGAAAGRGVYREAEESARIVAAARRSICELVHGEDPARVIFALNGTDALNLAIHGTLAQGDHVVTTVAEHNSVLRPLSALAQSGAIEVTYLGCDAEGYIDPDEVRRAWRPNTRLVALTHASNVTGAIQPAAEVGQIIRQRGGVFLLDAAQSLGDVPLDVRALGVDLLAAPGHKGLLGPLGTGLLYVRPGVDDRLRPVRQGGTGSRSNQDVQPSELPDRYEAGNLNVAGICGLVAGVEYVARRGAADIHQHALALTARLLDGLAGVSGVRVCGPRATGRRVGVVSMMLEGYDPQEAAMALDAGRRVQVRAGLHCAPRMHESLGTLDSGGTIRLSVGPFNTQEDIDAAVAAIGELAGG